MTIKCEFCGEDIKNISIGAKQKYHKDCYRKVKAMQIKNFYTDNRIRFLKLRQKSIEMLKERLDDYGIFLLEVATTTTNCKGVCNIEYLNDIENIINSGSGKNE